MDRLGTGRSHPDRLAGLDSCALVLGALIGCGGKSPTSPPGPDPTPTPSGGCPFILEVAPIAGFPGLYDVAPNPPGPYTISVNGLSRSIEFGVLVTANAGDLVQGCRPCGCTAVVVVR